MLVSVAAGLYYYYVLQVEDLYVPFKRNIWMPGRFTSRFPVGVSIPIGTTKNAVVWVFLGFRVSVEVQQ